MKKRNLNDVSHFCEHGSSILDVDTTFEITDNLWFIDTSFTNESLIDENKNLPEFPGPYMVHFRKDHETYQQFAAELAAAEPSLVEVKKVGPDLDSALFKGFGNIFQISHVTVACSICKKEMYSYSSFIVCSVSAFISAIAFVSHHVYFN